MPLHKDVGIILEPATMPEIIDSQYLICTVLVMKDEALLTPESHQLHQFELSLDLHEERTRSHPS